MNTVIVWVMIAMGNTGTSYSVGPEFTSKEKCEVAAQVVYKAVSDARWGALLKSPICVRIEK